MIYIFCGNDYATINDKYSVLIDAQNLSPVSFSSVKDMCAHIYQKALIAQNNAYVVRYDNDFMKADTAWQNILDASKDNTIILFYESILKTTKFYKFFSDCILEFNIEETNPVFTYTRAFCLADFKTCIISAREIKDSEVMYALSILYGRVRKILQIQTTPKGVKLEVNTGLQEKDKYANKIFLNRFTDSTLVYILNLIECIIDSIKKGKIDTNIALYLLVINLTY